LRDKLQIAPLADSDFSEKKAGGNNRKSITVAIPSTPQRAKKSTPGEQRNYSAIKEMGCPQIDSA